MEDNDNVMFPTICCNHPKTIGMKRKRIALAQAAWLTTFWISALRRKHPNADIKMDGTTLQVVKGRDDSEEETTSVSVEWNKLLQKELKRLHVEDLGYLDAVELWATIPEEDKESRGRKDLERLEQQLSVKVVFLERHVLLVGAKAKLEKKCLVIRNVLAHYYWRLKGKQILL
ncbi:hypothetical protein IV203_013288 [Nitzschia inconspicua]|uniref:Uncharacterized protein n=1 Tax=Nitzschia inconspicua TaxID=303405 RepID=A0A9K3M5R1_9STRA|nr:hypothetical protein IV203_013288 [Nitzschia inconspicua]